MREEMAPPATYEDVFHALVAQGLIVQVVDVQMVFAAAQGALAVEVGEEFSPFDLPRLGSHISVVIDRGRGAMQLGAQAFVVEFANAGRCGLQNFCARLFGHKIMIIKNGTQKTKKPRALAGFCFDRNPRCYILG